MTTYERIEEELARLRMDSTLSALYRAVDEEAEALARGVGFFGYVQPSKRLVFKEQAQEFYGEEILDCLYDTRPLEADQILGHRRKPTAWAIAAKIRDARGGKL